MKPVEVEPDEDAPDEDRKVETSCVYAVNHRVVYHLRLPPY